MYKREPFFFFLKQVNISRLWQVFNYQGGGCGCLYPLSNLFNLNKR